jgi:hypothetical protein
MLVFTSLFDLRSFLALINWPSPRDGKTVGALRLFGGKEDTLPNAGSLRSGVPGK